MKTVALSAIKVSPQRQRRIFEPGKMQEFTDNLRRTQLQNAPVLRIEGDDYVLVSGERRLRAIQDLALLGEQIRYDGALVPLGFIPYTLLSDLDPLAAEEAELDENLHRVNLSWTEEAAAIKRLTALRTAQAAARGAPPPPLSDIAVEITGHGINREREETRRKLILADHMDDPEVRAAKNPDDAWKLLKKKESLEKDRVLGEKVGRTFTADLHKAFNEDSLDWLTKCPAEQFDVILTDPPYGMGADEFGDSGGLAAGAHGYVDDEASFTRILSICQTELYRIAKAQAHLYWFCDIDQFHNIKLALSVAGWQVFRTPLIWYKKAGMRAPWPQSGPQRKYETILYAVKGKRPVNLIAGDVLDYAPDSNLGHAAQKPVALFEDLLRRSVKPGDSVLDPFCGSGPIFSAAHSLKCKATGIEMDTASYGIAVKRIEALKSQLDLGL